MALAYPRRVLYGLAGTGRSVWNQTSTQRGEWQARWAKHRAAGARRRQRARRERAVNLDAARVASSEGLQALARTLADPDPGVRILALEVICEFSEDRAARLLTGVLHDPEPSVRAAAAAAAGRLGASTVVFSLILALEDLDIEVREVSARALTQITGKKVELADAGDPVAIARQVADLKRWWKDERLSELVDEARKEPSS